MKLYYFPGACSLAGVRATVIAEEGSIPELTFGTTQPVAAISNLVVPA